MGNSIITLNNGNIVYTVASKFPINLHTSKVMMSTKVKIPVLTSASTSTSINITMDWMGFKLPLNNIPY